MPDRPDATDIDDEKETTLHKCDPTCDAGPRHSGPPREAGGTTGAGNLSPGQASRTGGATTGIPDPVAGPDDPADRARSRGIPPSA